MKLYCTDCRYLEKRPVRAEVPLDSGNYQETGWRYVCKLTGKSFQAMCVPEYDYCFHGEPIVTMKDHEEVYK